EYHGADSEADLRKYLDKQNRELRRAWQGWEIENVRSISNQFNDQRKRLKKLTDIEGALYDLIILERLRMLKAKELLSKLNKISLDEKSKLHRGIYGRKEKLLAFQNEKYKSLRAQL